MKTTSRAPLPRLDALRRERPQEERLPLHPPPPSLPDRKPEPVNKPEGGTCIVIQVWPTTPEPPGEDTGQAQ